MGTALPNLDREEFLARLRAGGGRPLDPAGEVRLWQHYQELRRWNRSLSLIGPGTASELVERHYAESLAALPLLEPGPRVLVDVGSGAGFPGFVIAAFRPDLDVTLVESQSRKWAFLEAACRKAALPCRCLNARVAFPLPEPLPAVMDYLTARALKLDEIVPALDERLATSAKILFWAGGNERFGAPPAWKIRNEVGLSGSHRRRIVVLERA